MLQALYVCKTILFYCTGTRDINRNPVAWAFWLLQVLNDLISIKHERMKGLSEGAKPSIPWHLYRGDRMWSAPEGVCKWPAEVRWKHAMQSGCCQIRFPLAVDLVVNMSPLASSLSPLPDTRPEGVTDHDTFKGLLHSIYSFLFTTPFGPVTPLLVSISFGLTLYKNRWLFQLHQTSYCIQSAAKWHIVWYVLAIGYFSMAKTL